MNKLNQLAVLASATLLAGTASAAVPTGVDTAVTNLQTDVIDTIELIIPAVIAVTSLFIVVKVIKKVLGKVG